MGTWILYGGPTLAYVWSPDTVKGGGGGVELGAELRRYFTRPLSGSFAGAYIGAGALEVWRGARRGRLDRLQAGMADTAVQQGITS